MSGLVLVVTVTCAIVVYVAGRRFGVTVKQALLLACVAAVGGVTGAFHRPGDETAITALRRQLETTPRPPVVVIPPDQLARVRRLGTPAAGAIDDIALSPAVRGSVDAPRRSVTVTRGSEVIFTGWAADPRLRDLGLAVTAFVDGKPAGAGEYGRERDDVAVDQGAARLRWSGFRLVVPTAHLAPGAHTVTLALVTHGGTDYEVLGPTLRLDVIR